MEHHFEEIAPGLSLLRVPFGGVWTGVVLIKGGRKILIDSGPDAAAAEKIILPALAETGVRAEELALLLCTHSHGDHVGGHARLAGAGALPCGVWEGGVEKLRNPLRFSKLIRASFPEYSPSPPPVLEGVEPQLLLRDGECAGDLQLIHTPGHDSDCVTFLDRRTGTLITGDSVQGGGTIAQGCALYMDLDAYRSSLEKLRKTGAERLVAGHAYLPWDKAVFSSPKEVEDCLSGSLRHIDRYDRIIRKLLARGIAGPPEIARRLIEETGGKQPQHLFLALHTVTEHLKHAVQ